MVTVPAPGALCRTIPRQGPVLSVPPVPHGDAIRSSHDLTTGVDIQGAAAPLPVRAEIGHAPLFPEEGATLSARRHARPHNLAAIVDPKTLAVAATPAAG